MSSEQMDAITALRAATRELHAQLDNVAYTQRLGRGEVGKDDYAHFLQTMRVLQAGLAELGEPARGRVEGVAGTRAEQLERLDDDLRDLGAGTALPAALASAGRALAEAISQSSERPDYALGIVYVVEGSAMGALHQRKVLREHPLLGYHAHRYLAGDGSNTRQRFTALISRLNAALTTPESIAEARAGAEITFARVYDVMSAL